jgi:hypothetical protein
MVESFRQFATGAPPRALTSVVAVEGTFSLAFLGGMKERGILFKDEMHHGLDAI